jgi:hypothetical protein
MPHANQPGDLHVVPADDIQPDKCLFTMSNNAATPERNGPKALFPSRIPEKRSFLHADKIESRLPAPPQGKMVEPDGIEPTTS